MQALLVDNWITKSSNGKLTYLEHHLTGYPCHVTATGPLLKLLKEKYEDKVPISEQEKKKAGNEIPKTIGNDKDLRDSLTSLISCKAWLASGISVVLECNDKGGMSDEEANLNGVGCKVHETADEAEIEGACDEERYHCHA
ncbi:hypothetical protein BT69DRAFT_1304489 [Atractiella rhizophila]|nr:hypothetical protein BT69DRAFT_1304489 [Atractiella rhizophila]